MIIGLREPKKCSRSTRLLGQGLLRLLNPVEGVTVQGLFGFPKGRQKSTCAVALNACVQSD